MNEMLGIFLSLFTAIGIVQCISWLFMRRRRREAAPLYQVMLLYDDPGLLESQLRYGTGWGCGQLVLVDMGLGEESCAVCERLLLRYPGVLLCRPEQLAEVLCGERLQEVQESGILK